MSERDTRNQQSDWNDRDRRDRDYRNAPRQPQQWHDESYGSGQFGYDDRSRDRDYGSGQQGGSHSAYSGGALGSSYGASYAERQRNWQEEDERAGQSASDHRDERQAYGSGFRGSSSGVGYGYGSGSYDDRASRFGSFTSEDQGGRDFTSTRQGPYVGRAASYGYAYGSGDRNRDYASGYSSGAYRDSDLGGRSSGSDYGRRERDWNRSNYHPQGYAAAGRDYMSGNDYGEWREYGESRGFFQRAGDEIASWFGDADASRRRDQDHRGRGPADYTRSDERIREDANDALTHDRHVDASRVTVKVDKGEVTLDGHVNSRDAKRRAEDAVENLSGVKHVQNNLRVEDDRDSAMSGTGSSWSAGSGGAANVTGAASNTTGGATTAGGIGSTTGTTTKTS
jgi:osmotically-inducible protein OsmY